MATVSIPLHRTRQDSQNVYVDCLIWTPDARVMVFKDYRNPDFGLTGITSDITEINRVRTRNYILTRDL